MGTLRTPVAIQTAAGLAFSTARAINSEVTTAWIDVDGADQFDLFVDYTYGAGTDVSIDMECSPDGVTAFELTVPSDSSGAITHNLALGTFPAGGASKKFVVPIEKPPGRYIRFLIAATGSPNSSDTAKLSGWLVKRS